MLILILFSFFIYLLALPPFKQLFLRPPVILAIAIGNVTFQKHSNANLNVMDAGTRRCEGL